MSKRSAEAALDDEPSKRGPAMTDNGAASAARICFPWLNHGSCSRGEFCKFRHLEQDHPDAVADRVRTGRVDKLVGKLPAEKVRA